MCACAAFRRIVSKSCSEIRMLNCLSFFMFPPFSLKWVWASARFEAFGREPVCRRLAKCDAGSSRTGGFFPPRRDFSALLRNLPARWRNVGFFGCAAHTPAAGVQSRTQRRHAPHGAAQAVCLPAGSIGSMFPTVGRSAPSALFRQISRSPLLFRNDTKMPFFLRESTLFRI